MIWSAYEKCFKSKPAPRQVAAKQEKMAAHLFIRMERVIALMNGSSSGILSQQGSSGGIFPHAEKNQKIAASKEEIAAPASSHFSIASAYCFQWVGSMTLRVLVWLSGEEVIGSILNLGMR